MVFITIVTGAYKPTYNWGGHIASEELSCGTPSHHPVVFFHDYELVLNLYWNLWWWLGSPHDLRKPLKKYPFDGFGDFTIFHPKVPSTHLWPQKALCFWTPPLSQCFERRPQGVQTLLALGRFSRLSSMVNPLTLRIRCRISEAQGHLTGYPALSMVIPCNHGKLASAPTSAD